MTGMNSGLLVMARVTGVCNLMRVGRDCSQEGNMDILKRRYMLISYMGVGDNRLQNSILGEKFRNAFEIVLFLFFSRSVGHIG